MVHPARFERATSAFGGQRSIQLSYGCVACASTVGGGTWQWLGGKKLVAIDLKLWMALGTSERMKTLTLSTLRAPLLILASALTAAALTACGQAGTVDGKVSAARARNDAPPIWYVKDYDSTLYLFGTLHLLSPEVDWISSDMEQVFRDSGTVFFEIDTGRDAQIEATVLTQSLGFRTDGRRLSDKLDSYQLKLLDAAANNAGLPVATLDNMKPWLASEFLTIAAATKAGLSPDLSADNALKSRAQAQGKNVVYLDDMTGQLTRAAEQTHSAQMLLLSDTLEGFNTLGDDLKKIAQSWSVGRTDFLTVELIDEVKSRAPDIYQTFFTDVNREWAKPLTQFMEGSGDGFVAIGVGHLLGDESIQELLREQGYEVGRYYAFKGEPVIKTIPLDVSGEN